jgi:hypothetical protein
VKNLIWILAIISSLCFGMTMAQNQVFPSCAQTLKQSPEAFLKRYPSTNNGQAAAAVHWTNCKSKQNDQRLRRYPKLAVRLERLGKLENDFVTAQFSLAPWRNGGDNNSFFRVLPDIQLHLEILIRLTISKAEAVTNTAIRTRYARAKLEIESRIARVIANPPKHRSSGRESDGLMNLLWLRIAKEKALEYQKAYREILDLIGSQQNATNLEVLEFLNTSLFANEL